MLPSAISMLRLRLYSAGGESSVPLTMTRTLIQVNEELVLQWACLSAQQSLLRQGLLLSAWLELLWCTFYLSSGRVP